MRAHQQERREDPADLRYDHEVGQYPGALYLRHLVVGNQEQWLVMRVVWHSQELKMVK